MAKEALGATPINSQKRNRFAMLASFLLPYT